VACASAPEPGPPFSELPVPHPDRALLYIYRQDRLSSRGAARVDLDGENVGKLGNGQYLWLELAPGRHTLKTRWGGALPWAAGWNSLPIELGAGSTRYLRLEVDAQEVPRPDGPTGDYYRGDRREQYSLNLYSVFAPAAEALEELRSSRLGERAGD
jgi:hypothetical protein